MLEIRLCENSHIADLICNFKIIFAVIYRWAYLNFIDFNPVVRRIANKKACLPDAVLTYHWLRFFYFHCSMELQFSASSWVSSQAIQQVFCYSVSIYFFLGLLHPLWRTFVAVFIEFRINCFSINNDVHFVSKNQEYQEYPIDVSIWKFNEVS